MIISGALETLFFCHLDLGFVNISYLRSGLYFHLFFSFTSMEVNLFYSYICETINCLHSQVIENLSDLARSLPTLSSILRRKCKSQRIRVAWESALETLGLQERDIKALCSFFIVHSNNACYYSANQRQSYTRDIISLINRVVKCQLLKHGLLCAVHMVENRKIWRKFTKTKIMFETTVLMRSSWFITELTRWFYVLLYLSFHPVGGKILLPYKIFVQMIKIMQPLFVQSSSCWSFYIAFLVT